MLLKKILTQNINISYFDKNIYSIDFFIYIIILKFSLKNKNGT